MLNNKYALYEHKNKTVRFIWSHLLLLYVLSSGIYGLIFLL